MVSMSKIVIKNYNRRRSVEQNNPNTSATWFRRNNPENQKYCRRHGFGENTEEGSDAAELIVNDQN